MLAAHTVLFVVATQIRVGDRYPKSAHIWLYNAYGGTWDQILSKLNG